MAAMTPGTADGPTVPRTDSGPIAGSASPRKAAGAGPGPVSPRTADSDEEPRTATGVAEPRRADHAPAPRTATGPADPHPATDSAMPHTATGSSGPPAPTGPADPHPAAPPTAPAARRRRPRPRIWRGAVLALAGAYFLLPLLASFVFTVHVPGQGVSFDAYTQLIGADGFTESLLLSLGLAAATIALSLLLAVPALIAVRIGPPRLRPLVEVLCTLPLVVPPIALVTGITTVLRRGPEHLAHTPFYRTFLAVQDESFPVVLVLAYTVLALPFVHRALDAGLRAVDVPTLVEASRNCGASWPYTVFRVILPNLRTSLAGAAFLTLALVLGEFTIASLLGFRPFAVWIVSISGSHARMSVAVSLLSLVITWVLLLALSRAGTARAAAPARKES